MILSPALHFRASPSPCQGSAALSVQWGSNTQPQCPRRRLSQAPLILASSHENPESWCRQEPHCRDVGLRLRVGKPGRASMAGTAGGCIWTQAEVPSLTVDLLFGSKCHDTCALGKLAAITGVVVCIGWNQAPQQPLCPQDPLDVARRCWPRGEVSSGHRVNSEAEGPIRGSVLHAVAPL